MAATKPEMTDSWVMKLCRRRHKNIAAVALAAKNARTAWALLIRNQVIKEVAACTCDRCGRRMTPDAAQPYEWAEKLSIAFRGGYGSVFGDGNDVSIDLCQHCVRDTLGEWLRIEPPDGPTGVE
jgi:hypothetical protein